MSEGRLLAVDYGQKSIGLAVSDQSRTMAFGRGVLKNQPGDAGRQMIFSKILDLCRADSISKILIGLPLGANQEDTPQTLKIRDFTSLLMAFLLESGLKIEEEFVDESFSSYEANKILAEMGVRGGDRKKTEDEMSAIILIHRYIDFRP